MAIGDGSQVTPVAYVAAGKEGTFGTYNTCTTVIEALSCNIKSVKETLKIDSIGAHRGFTKRVMLEKTVEGNVESYLHPVESMLHIIAALGGSVTSASLSSASFVHSISAGNFDQSITSMCMNVRKGGTHTWLYSGGRVNTLKISAAPGEPVKISAEMVFKDATQTANDISTALTMSSVLPFTFAQGGFRWADTEASLTSTAAETVQGFELTINNNLATGKESRALGSDVLSVIPGLRREISLTVNQRFDTTTAWTRYTNATPGAVEIVFSGAQLGTAGTYLCNIRLPKVYLQSPEPELGGASEVIQSELVFDCIVDNPMTTTGRDIGITLQNLISSAGAL